MAIEYLGLSSINGPLVVLDGVENAAYDAVSYTHLHAAFYFPSAAISLAATSLQIGFPSAANFVSYSVITFPSAISL